MDHSGRATIAAPFRRLRSHELLWWLALALSARVSSAAIQAVSFDDPRIVYTGDWTDSGDHKFTIDTHARLSFEFVGTAISFVSRHNPNGAVAQISIDGQSMGLADESANTKEGDAPQEAVLLSHSDLDASRTHTLALSWENTGQYGGTSVEVYGFEYVQDGDAPTTVASFTSTSTQTSSSQVKSNGPLSIASKLPASSSSASPSSAPSSSASSLPTSPPSTPSSSAVALPTSSLPASGSSGSLSSPSRHTKTSRSALIGGIVGGILGGVLGCILLFIFIPRLRRRAAQWSQQKTDLERGIQPYTFRSDAANDDRHGGLSPANSMSPMNRNAVVSVLSEDSTDSDLYGPMQQTGTSLAPALGLYYAGWQPSSIGAAFMQPDYQASSGSNVAPGRASTSSENDSDGTPPSYMHSPSDSTRYWLRRLPDVPAPKT